MEPLTEDETILWTALFEQAGDGMVVLRQDGSVYRANRYYADMLGYTQEDMEALHVWDRDTRFTREELLERLGRPDDSGAHFDSQQRRNDGAIIDVEFCSNVATYRGEKLIFCIVRDITRRKAAEEKVLAMAITDGLTGINNRQEFSRLLEHEINRAARYETPLSLIMYDLDHFRQVNDRFGHDTGDEVLRTVTGLIDDNIRSVDFHGRWGGEEFMVLLPQTGLGAAREVAGKLRPVIADHRFDKAGTVTASFGVAELGLKESSRSLTQRAEEALYRAKEAGGNRVET